MKPHGFPRAVRITRPADYERIYALRQKAGDDRLLIFAAPNSLGLTRAGIVVSRRHGNSVRRSLLKRRLREAFRLCRSELPTGCDLILIPRHGTETSVADYQTSLKRIVPRLYRRLQREAR